VGLTTDPMFSMHPMHGKKKDAPESLAGDGGVEGRPVDRCPRDCFCIPLLSEVPKDKCTINEALRLVNTKKTMYRSFTMATKKTKPLPEDADVALTTRVSQRTYDQLVKVQARAEKEAGFKPTVSAVARKMIEIGLKNERVG
jgi:hypothetical protein